MNEHNNDIDKNELIQSLMRLRKRCCGGVSAACMTTNDRTTKDNAEFQKIIQGVKSLITERDEAKMRIKELKEEIEQLKEDLAGEDL